MKKFLALLLLLSLSAIAGLPLTTSKIVGDASNKTTFNFQFPNFTGTHTGTTVSLGVNNIAGGGTNSSTALTNNKAMQSVAGQIVESSVTSTELGYLSGVTSLIQTQLNTKVTGPASATDNAIARFDLTTGKLIQNSLALVDDSGNISGNDLTFTDANYSTLSTKKTLSHQMSTGVIDGSVLSINANPTLFNLSAQILSFSDGSISLDTPAVKFVNCGAQTGVTVTNLATADTSYISVSPTCTIIQSTTFPTQVQRRTNAFIGRLSHINRTSITLAAGLPDLVVDTNSQVYDLFDAMGAFNISGNVISPNGANLSFNKSAGSVFRRSANYTTNKQNPHVISVSGATPQSFIRVTQTSVNATPTSTVDVANYDVAGTVTAIPGGGATSTNRRIYLFSSGTVAIQYGQVTYTNLANAIAGISTESFVINPQAADGGILLAVLSCTKSATDISNLAQCQINRVGRFDQTGVTTGSLATTTLQQAYNNSVTPQITTSTANGSIDIQRGSAADTDFVFRILNGAGTPTASITGAGSLALATPLSIANGGTGQITKAAAFDALSPMTTGGDLIYGGTSGTGTRLANGSSGQFLKSNGGTAAPSWATTNNTTAILAKTGSYTLLTSDQVVYWDTSAGVGTATLPTAVGNGGLTLTISVQVGVNALTVNTTSSQTIAGVASGSITMKNPGDRLQVISDGANWLVVSKTSGVGITPGFQGNVDFFSVRYSGATSTTVCSSTPCTISQKGNAVSSVSWTTPSTYGLNTTKTYTELTCTHSGSGAGATSGVVQGAVLNCTNCNSITFMTRRLLDETTNASYGTLVCQGTY